MRTWRSSPASVTGRCSRLKSYRLVLRDQPFLLPVDMREWLPADHLVSFLLATIDVVDTR